MKSSRLLALLCLLSIIALWGCEGERGPAGPSGTDGTDGTDGTGVALTCLDCHNTPAQNAITQQYNRSVHALGQYVDYTGGLLRGSCVRCHTGLGFTYYAVNGVAPEIGYSTPEPINCNSCHEIHSSFEVADLALRLTGPVAANFGDYTFDFQNGHNDSPNSNLCVNCHQARTAEPNVASPGATFTISNTHYGPHHGPQGNVVAGYGFAEVAGSTPYPSGSVHMNAGASCVTCHMGEYSDGAGGHTWNPNVFNCQGCHNTEDFDYHGKQTETEELLVELRDLLVEAGVVEFVVADDAYEPVVGTYPMVQAQAYYNWIGLEEDRSLGVHNFPYVEALLMNSIEALSAGK